MKRLSVALLLFCLGAVPFRAAPEASAGPWQDLMAQAGQDGAFERDADLDKKPDRWLQHQDLPSGFMHYGQVMLEPAPGASVGAARYSAIFFPGTSKVPSAHSRCVRQAPSKRARSSASCVSSLPC